MGHCEGVLRAGWFAVQRGVAVGVSRGAPLAHPRIRQSPGGRGFPAVPRTWVGPCAGGGI